MCIRDREWEAFIGPVWVECAQLKNESFFVRDSCGFLCSCGVRIQNPQRASLSRWWTNVLLNCYICMSKLDQSWLDVSTPCNLALTLLLFCCRSVNNSSSAASQGAQLFLTNVTLSNFSKNSSWVRERESNGIYECLQAVRRIKLNRLDVGRAVMWKIPLSVFSCTLSFAMYLMLTIWTFFHFQFFEHSLIWWQTFTSDIF